MTRAILASVPMTLTVLKPVQHPPHSSKSQVAHKAGEIGIEVKTVTRSGTRDKEETEAEAETAKQALTSGVGNQGSTTWRGCLTASAVN